MPSWVKCLSWIQLYSKFPGIDNDISKQGTAEKELPQNFELICSDLCCGNGQDNPVTQPLNLNCWMQVWQRVFEKDLVYSKECLISLIQDAWASVLHSKCEKHILVPAETPLTQNQMLAS